MTDLINIQVKNDNQLVSARELHKNLGLKNKFSAWWEQSSSSFENEIDFTREPQSYLVQSGNGTVRKYDDYALTIANILGLFTVLVCTLTIIKRLYTLIKLT